MFTGELDLTMLRQMCRRGRLQALIQDTSSTTTNTLVGAALDTLGRRQLVSDGSLPRTGPALVLSKHDEAIFNAAGTNIPSDIYVKILLYWNDTHSPPHIHYNNLTYSLLDVDVHPKYAVPVHHIEQHTRTFSTKQKTPGASSISFTHPKTKMVDAGWILSMWRQALNGQLFTFIVVQPHTPLTEDDFHKTPYRNRPKFECALVYAQPQQVRELVIIEEKNLQAHVAYVERPEKTFGIKEKIIILNNAVNRRRM